MNNNKISIIPTLILITIKIIGSWFAQPPKPPDHSEEMDGHYEYVEDVIASAIEMKRESEMSEYSGVFEMQQGEITEEEVIEAMRHISSHKAQGSDDQ
ncbi:hypothetical protein RFI_40199 [Reticulomyxa filosa]|uniref:Uncharacterized protein n=1 Tax=Reticulomyxa filosa TaxID=46433 RepID=X6L714_RETFI|nr:hypothetical protein RFI_40199 [Reticulomyxa filosa]|eukprot:ETN97332.1 hypothetical protein RFI_40199 [Reticulomyxa filosa]